jgi:hypothetical protein
MAKEQRFFGTSCECVSAPKEDPSINRLKMLSWLVNLPSRRVPIGADWDPIHTAILRALSVN